VDDDAILEQYGEAIRRYCRRRTWSAADAEDATQTTYLRWIGRKDRDNPAAALLALTGPSAGRARTLPHSGAPCPHDHGRDPANSRHGTVTEVARGHRRGSRDGGQARRRARGTRSVALRRALASLRAGHVRRGRRCAGAGDHAADGAPFCRDGAALHFTWGCEQVGAPAKRRRGTGTCSVTTGRGRKCLSLSRSVPQGSSEM